MSEQRCDGCAKRNREFKQYAGARLCLYCWWSRLPEMPGPDPRARIADLEAKVKLLRMQRQAHVESQMAQKPCFLCGDVVVKHARKEPT